MVSPAIHYLGVVGTAANQDHARCPAQWERIKAERADEYGPDGAYNFGACVHGTTFVGRGWNRDSAANGSQGGVNYNRGSRALCALVGTDDVWTHELEQACADFANEAFARGFPHPLKAHSDFVATACCGDNGRDFIDRFNTGEFDEMDQAKFNEMADEWAFAPTKFGYSRMEAWYEKYAHGPTVFGVTRFQSWWNKAKEFWDPRQ